MQNGLTDVDHPESKYDYRGYFRQFGNKPIRFGVDHFTDTYKQHGHPVFSAESQYSRGAWDGGRWIGETLVAPPMAAHDNRPRRADGSVKGRGFLGPLQRLDGGVSSELSIGVEFDGEEVDIPLLVPTLSKDEVQFLINMAPEAQPPESIVRKAVAFARTRRMSGQPYFKGDR